MEEKITTANLNALMCPEMTQEEIDEIFSDSIFSDSIPSGFIIKNTTTKTHQLFYKKQWKNLDPSEYILRLREHD